MELTITCKQLQYIDVVSFSTQCDNPNIVQRLLKKKGGWEKVNCILFI